MSREVKTAYFRAINNILVNFPQIVVGLVVLSCYWRMDMGGCSQHRMKWLLWIIVSMIRMTIKCLLSMEHYRIQSYNDTTVLQTRPYFYLLALMRIEEFFSLLWFLFGNVWLLAGDSHASILSGDSNEEGEEKGENATALYPSCHPFDSPIYIVGFSYLMITYFLLMLPFLMAIILSNFSILLCLLSWNTDDDNKKGVNKRTIDKNTEVCKFRDIYYLETETMEEGTIYDNNNSISSGTSTSTNSGTRTSTKTSTSMNIDIDINTTSTSSLNNSNKNGGEKLSTSQSLDICIEKQRPVEFNRQTVNLNDNTEQEEEREQLENAITQGLECTTIEQNLGSFERHVNENTEQNSKKKEKRTVERSFFKQTFSWKEKKKIKLINSENDNVNLRRPASACPICLIDYEFHDDIRKLPCKHYFHKKCIDHWLIVNSTCPTCRSDLISSSQNMTE